MLYHIFVNTKLKEITSRDQNFLLILADFRYSWIRYSRMILYLFFVFRDVEDLRAALNECNQRVKELTLKLDNFDDVSAFQVNLIVAKA